MLHAAGAHVHLAGTVYQAMLVVDRTAISAAVLDTDLGRQTISQICSHLESRAVPVLLVVNEVHEAEHLRRRVPMLRKPVDTAKLAAVLREQAR